jgi:phytoene dehydrogenase-like protein
LPSRYRRALEGFRYGPGCFKIDWALDGPIPWTAVECARAGTVHLGGTLKEIVTAEAAPWQNEVSEKPFVLLAQPSLFDATRAPHGKHTAWAYCHVPHGATMDMTHRIEAQIERFAPGFLDLVLARHVICGSSFSGRRCASIPTGCRSTGCTSARPPRLLGAAFTECAAISPPWRRSGTFS